MDPNTEKKNRITPYLRKYLDSFVFDSLNPAVFQRNPELAFMKDCPIPFRREDLELVLKGREINPRQLAENMIWVIGCDPDFPYTESYCAWIRHHYGTRAGEMLLEQSDHEVEKGNGESAMVCLRAALVLDPENRQGLYNYGLFCTQCYQSSEDEEYVGRFKAESLESFEKLSELDPGFAPAYYYLGYHYINMGLYTKAGLTWKRFLDLSDNEEEIEEIRERMDQLLGPMEIERGCNAILTNRWQEGLQTLEPFVDGEFGKWWPLHYYIGIGSSRLGQTEKAEESFKKVLSLNPSHTDSMEELAAIYEFRGDSENAMKYRRKAEMLMKGEDQF
ncbi:MAG: tetratricopeptide repeat protein [Firmicutes bacterium]|nr:tetratricopeptide repeat protein [Clostridiales bacterium]MBQ9931339.1 tetratricopeptide repeat protein [Bacillota bacterium]